MSLFDEKIEIKESASINQNKIDKTINDFNFSMKNSFNEVKQLIDNSNIFEERHTDILHEGIKNRMVSYGNLTTNDYLKSLFSFYELGPNLECQNQLFSVLISEKIKDHRFKIQQRAGVFFNKNTSDFEIHTYELTLDLRKLNNKAPSPRNLEETSPLNRLGLYDSEDFRNINLYQVFAKIKNKVNDIKNFTL